MMIETGYGDYPRDSFHVEDLTLIADRGTKYLTNSRNHGKLWGVGENI